MTNFRKYFKAKDQSAMKYAKAFNDGELFPFLKNTYNISEIAETMKLSKGEQFLVDTYLRNIKFLWLQIKQDWSVYVRKHSVNEKYNNTR